MEAEPEMSPQGLIDAFSVQRMHFGPGEKYESLTAFVKDTSKMYRCPMSAESTGSGKRTQIYRCRFGGRQRGSSSKTNCPCYVRFMRNSDDSFSFVDANWGHNHSVDKKYFEAHFSCVTIKEMESIKQLQNNKVSPTQIRNDMQLNVNKDIFYNIRRANKAKPKANAIEKPKKKNEDIYSAIGIDNNLISNTVFINIFNNAINSNKPINRTEANSDTNPNENNKQIQTPSITINDDNESHIIH